MSTSPEQSANGSAEKGPSVVARLAAAGAVLIGLLAGIFVLGRLASNDLMAMAFTTVFFGAVFLLLAFIVWRRRAWLLPLAVPFVVVTVGAGVLLGAPLVVDDVVDEDVVTVSDTPVPSGGATAGPAETRPTNTAVARGSFEPLSHPGEGVATIIATTDESVKLTLTDFATDNGPDVRVYLSRGTDADGRGASFVDLGALKGNRGNQQYDVPSDLDLSEFDAVVLWCRAFDVGFTQAPLTAV
jgi:Electron transfer DM13